MAAPLSGEDYDSYLSELRTQELRRQSASAFFFWAFLVVVPLKTQEINPPITEVMGYPLVNKHSYSKWPIIVDFPIKKGFSIVMLVYQMVYMYILYRYKTSRLDKYYLDVTFMHIHIVFINAK